MQTKIDVISGFLGAGKTTFIKTLVTGIYAHEKVVVLENEFGKVNIDGDTLKREGLAVQSIAAGCICCSNVGDLSLALVEIMRNFNPERIIIEPTGVARLSDVLYHLQQKELLLDHVVTVVDVKNYQQRNKISKLFYENQIKASNLLVCSKTEMLPQTQVEEVINAVQAINLTAKVLDKPWHEICAVDLEAQIQSAKHTGGKYGIKLHSPFVSVDIVRQHSVTQQMLRTMIAKLESGAYGAIARVKGICIDEKSGTYSIEYVPQDCRFTKISDDIAYNCSKICIIGSGLEKEAIQVLL